MKIVWLWFGFWVGRYIFRRPQLSGPELIKRFREIGAL